MPPFWTLLYLNCLYVLRSLRVESFNNLKLNPARMILELQLRWILTQSPAVRISREWSTEKVDSLLPCMEGFIPEITFQITPASP